MILLRKNNLFYLSITFLLILAFSQLVSAQEFSFTDAVQQGLHKNSELVKLETQVAGLKRNLAEIRASQSWQVNLGASSAYTGGGTTEQVRSLPSSSTGQDSRNWGEYGVQVKMQKAYPFGLTLKPELAFDIDDWSSELNMRLDQQLYPFLPTDAEKSYFKGTYELQKGILQLQAEQAAKVVEWITSYLNLVRLDQEAGFQEMEKKLAADTVQEVTASLQIGEASRQEMLKAEVDLKQADYQLQTTRYKLAEEQEALSLELGLTPDDRLILEEGLIDTLQGLIADLDLPMVESNSEMQSLPQIDFVRLVERLAQTDTKLLVNQLDRDVLKQELKWSRKEGKTDLNLSGNYNSGSTEWSLGLNLSYQLSDGGQRGLRLEEKEEQLQGKEQEYEQLYAKIRLEAEQLKHQLELGEMALSREKLKLERVTLETQIAQTQYQLGLLDQGAFEQKKLLRSEAELALKSTQDQLLLQQLKLTQLLQPSLLSTWLTK